MERKELGLHFSSHIQLLVRKWADVIVLVVVACRCPPTPRVPRQECREACGSPCGKEREKKEIKALHHCMESVLHTESTNK